jgi:hypothetical protein
MNKHLTAKNKHALITYSVHRHLLTAAHSSIFAGPSGRFFFARNIANASIYIPRRYLTKGLA